MAYDPDARSALTAQRTIDQGAGAVGGAREIHWLVDTENLVFDASIRDAAAPDEVFAEFLPRLLNGVAAITGADLVHGDAVGDFERMPPAVRSVALRAGLAIRHVSCQAGKSSAEVEMAILCADHLHAHPSTSRIVIGSGDGDVAPIVMRAHAAGVEVFIVAFGVSLNTRLKALVGADHVIDARDFLPPNRGPAPSVRPVGTAPTPTTLPGRKPGTAEDMARALLKVAVEEYVLAHGTPKVALLSLSHKFTLRFPRAHPGAFTATVEALKDNGAATVCQQPSLRHPSRMASMLVPDPAHPMVLELLNGRPWPPTAPARTRAA